MARETQAGREGANAGSLKPIQNNGLQSDYEPVLTRNAAIADGGGQQRWQTTIPSPDARNQAALAALVFATWVAIASIKGGDRQS
jgi:hypothetical protein